MAKRTSTYLTDRTLQVAGDGDSLSGALNRIVDRYGEICRRLRVEDRFSSAELDVLRAVANGWLAEPAATIAGGLALEVADTESEEFEAFDVDRAALLSKLNDLNFAEEVALVDGIERYWRKVSGSSEEGE